MEASEKLKGESTLRGAVAQGAFDRDGSQRDIRHGRSTRGRMMNLALYRKTVLPGDRGLWWKAAWYIISCLVFQSGIVLPSGVRAGILRIFGAKVGANLVIRSRVRIKYPWFLELGDHVWIGESTWIDQHCVVRVGTNVCISQAAYLFTGNHDYRDPAFAFFAKPITLEDGVWVGARAVVCPGARLQAGTVLSAGAVFKGTSDPGVVYAGNPAIAIKPRLKIQSWDEI